MRGEAATADASRLSRHMLQVRARFLPALLLAALLSGCATQPAAADVAANANLIVSGNEDLLALNTHQGIPIVTPAEALRIISTP